MCLSETVKEIHNSRFGAYEFLILYFDVCVFSTPKNVQPNQICT